MNMVIQLTEGNTMTRLQQSNEIFEDLRKLSESSPDFSFKFVNDKPCVFRLEPHETIIIQENDGWHISILDDPTLEEEMLKEIEQHCGKRVFSTLVAAVDATNRFEMKTELQRISLGEVNLPTSITLEPDAYNLIMKECTQHADLNSECGGSLFGLMSNSKVFVKKGAPTGSAQKSYSHIRTDAELQSQHFQAAKHQGLNYLGDWHLHPMSVHKLSCTDVNTIRKIMANERHLIPNGILTAILVVADKKKLVFHGFVARLLHGQLEIKEVPVSIPYIEQEEKQSVVFLEEKNELPQLITEPNGKVSLLQNKRILFPILAIIPLIIFFLIIDKQSSADFQDYRVNDNLQVKTELMHSQVTLPPDSMSNVSPNADTIKYDKLIIPQLSSRSKGQQKYNYKVTSVRESLNAKDTSQQSQTKTKVTGKGDSLDLPLDKVNLRFVTKTVHVRHADGKPDSSSLKGNKSLQSKDSPVDSQIIPQKNSTSHILPATVTVSGDTSVPGNKK